MPEVNGTTTGGEQYALPFSTLSAVNFQLQFTSQGAAVPVRTGYGFVICRNVPTTPAIARILWHGPLYTPGMQIDFTGVYGFSGRQYALFCRWNIPGLPFKIVYV